MYQNNATGESNLTTGHHQWRYRCYRGRRYAIANHQAVTPGSFVLPSGGPHDIVGCFIQSAKAQENHVVPYGYPPTRQPRKKRSLSERYFGYKNVVFVNHGGTTRAVWAGGKVTNVPARLFYTTDFHPTFENGWAFLADGRVIYMAKDQALVEFGLDYARVNGENFLPESYPRAKMPGLDGYSLTSDGGMLTFDFDHATVVGTLKRMPGNVTFGCEGK